MLVGWFRLAYLGNHLVLGWMNPTFLTKNAPQGEFS